MRFAGPNSRTFPVAAPSQAGGLLPLIFRCFAWSPLFKYVWFWETYTTICGGGRYLHQVFISHAGNDKPYVRPIVDALIHLGWRVFIDRPLEFGYTVDELRALRGRIRYIDHGRDWRQKLIEELGKSDVVLGCLSPSLLQDRRVLNTELNTALAMGKLVTCLIRGTRSRDLDSELEMFNPKDAQSEPVDDVKLTAALECLKRGEALSAELAEEWGRFTFIEFELSNRVEDLQGETQGEPRASLPEPDLPSLDEFRREAHRANREPQRRALDRAISDVSKGGVHAFAITGPANESVDMFAEKIRECREARGLTHPLLWYETELPGRSAVREDRFFEDYASGLATTLKMPEDAELTFDSLARAIVEKSATLIIVSEPMMRQRIDRKRLDQFRLWLKFWGRIMAAPAAPSVVAILRISMPAAEPGWQFNGASPCPPDAEGENGRTNQAFMKQMRALETSLNRFSFMSFFGSPPVNPPFAVLDVLEPVVGQDARSWVRIVCDELYEQADQVSIRIFGGFQQAQTGMAMFDFDENAPVAVREALKEKRATAG